MIIKKNEEIIFFMLSIFRLNNNRSWTRLLNTFFQKYICVINCIFMFKIQLKVIVGLSDGKLVLRNYPIGSSNNYEIQAHTSGSAVRDIKMINNVTAVTCSLDIKVWNLLTQTSILTIPNPHSGLINAIEVLREDVIVSTGVDQKVKVCWSFFLY